MSEPMISLFQTNHPTQGYSDYRLKAEQANSLQLQNEERRRAQNQKDTMAQSSMAERKSLSDIMRANTMEDGSINKLGVVKQAYNSPYISPATTMKIEEAWKPDIKNQQITGIIKKNGGNIKQTYADLQQVDPDYAQKYITEISKNSQTFFDTKKKDYEYIANWLSTASPEMYPAIVSMARANGYDASEIPDVITPDFAKQFSATYSSAEQKTKAQDQAYKAEDLKLKQNAANIDAQKLAIEQKKLDETIRANKADEVIKRDKKTTEPPKTFDDGKPMPSDSAKALGLIANGIEGAQTFHDALTKGDANFWTTSLIGNFTNPDARIAFDKMTESLGRLNSGGAITKDEEKRFVRMLADKKNLVTEQGRKAIATELEKFINRGKSTGDLIYGSQNWQNRFNATSASQPSGSTSKLSDTDAINQLFPSKK